MIVSLRRYKTVRISVQVHFHPDESVHVELACPLASVDKAHMLAAARPRASPGVAAEFTPDKDVLRVVDALGFVCAASVEVYELEVARGGEGEEGAVVAPCEHLGVLRVERNPVRLRESITATSVI